ncbi:gluconate transporter [Rosenbergiella collisarenosi]|uniref:GntP family permease n=1 Tax=Rosenbergiella collisarenosi TaxID=1544695 RepID=UPI001BDAF123|nr:gluconate:H+ symporter [Rosenbergiella collisarenosi]MBT0721761.1 gluconate transporter [Rosenbergiella collisarenosi]
MSSDSLILFSCIAALAAIILSIAYAKLPPFLAIFLGTILAGLIAGVPLEHIAKSFSKGAGGILGESGYIIAMGAMLGSLMANTGAADRLAEFIIAKTSSRLLPWVMAFTAMLIGLPLFFEVGLVLMLPLIATVSARSGQSLLRIAVPVLAGLTTLHALVPPHPGPIIAITTLHADMGLTLLLGIVIAIPAVIFAGPLYGKWLSHKPSLATVTQLTTLPASVPVARSPSLPLAIGVIILPALLMLARSLSLYIFNGQSALAQFFDFIGEPLIALTLTVLVALLTLGWRSGIEKKQLGEALTASIAPVAVLLLTIGAGGGLKGVLVEAGISQSITHFTHHTHAPLLLLAWGIAVALRQATGSATVATTTTAGIFAASFQGLPPLESSLIALSIGAGSVFFCHINDAGYWMIKSFFDLTLKQTLWIWSLLQTIVSLIGLMMVSILWWVLI